MKKASRLALGAVSAPSRWLRTFEPVPRPAAHVRDGKHHHQVFAHDVGQGEREALHDEVPHVQGSSSRTRSGRAQAGVLGDDLKVTTELGQELGSKSRSLVLVPVDDGIHLLDRSRVEFEVDHFSAAAATGG